MVLANGVIRALDRATLLDETRTLRSARRLPPTDPEIAPVLMQEVWITYPDGAVGVQNVSLALQAGEWAAVIGPSGSGKSTLLRAMAGLLPPSQGFLVRLGVRLLPGRLGDRVDCRVGFVFQNPDEQLFGSTPLEDLCWGLQRLDVADAEAESRAVEMLKQLDIAHLGHRPIHRLSFGERKRVAFAAALVCEPELLLCDEPTSNLDVVAAQRLMTILERVATQRDITVVWTTHDITALPRRVRRVVLLRDGRLTFDGRRDEGLSAARLAQAGLLAEGAERLPEFPPDK
jgi:cobalt/nickel transport system ATP-binding protein